MDFVKSLILLGPSTSEILEIINQMEKEKFSSVMEVRMRYLGLTVLLKAEVSLNMLMD